MTQLAEQTQAPPHPGVGTQRFALASTALLPASEVPVLDAPLDPPLEALVLPDEVGKSVGEPPQATVARGLAPTTETMSRNVRCNAAFDMPGSRAKGAPGPARRASAGGRTSKSSVAALRHGRRTPIARDRAVVRGTQWHRSTTCALEAKRARPPMRALLG
jgi:hypothetical protein